MLKRILPNWFVGVVATLVLLANTLIWGTVVLLFGIVKLVLPLKPISNALHFGYYQWCRGNALGLRIGCGKIHVEVDGQVSKQGWYLLMANHLSWLDIVVLSAVDVLPAPKFFLKDELKYVPFIGSGAWALGMPFMKRATKAQIAKNPKLKGLDVERTKASCKAFRDYPTTIINFVEGTRFTARKHSQQNSPFRHLLKPKAGGVAFALEVLASQLDGILNTTLIYDTPDQHICRSFMQGRLNGVRVAIAQRTMDSVPVGNYQLDKEYRVQFQHYVNSLWQEKDAFIEAQNAVLVNKMPAVHKELEQL
ncbi:acetyltransferase [Pseudoalteromonas fenneropenaei]|uniref:Acetyltransferase n=1 Tax=Pseudoalteromonas fenneropenaei TaxID=1737459 RepID=A0ABV7CM68_9GAMM